MLFLFSQEYQPLMWRHIVMAIIRKVRLRNWWQRCLRYYLLVFLQWNVNQSQYAMFSHIELDFVSYKWQIYCRNIKLSCPSRTTSVLLIISKFTHALSYRFVFRFSTRSNNNTLLFGFSRDKISSHNCLVTRDWSFVIRRSYPICICEGFYPKMTMFGKKVFLWGRL